MSFFLNPRTSLVRRWLFLIHLAAGLSVGSLALVAGLSGAALVYAPELELAPRWAQAPAPTPLSLDALARTAAERHPGFRLQDVRFNTAGDPVVLHLQPSAPPRTRTDDLAAGRPDLYLLVDPASGAITRTVDRRSGPWAFLRSLHHDLFAGRTGRIVNGIGALALLLLCLTGMIIWWPGPAAWTRRVRVARVGNWKRVNWDLHNAAGFWLAAGLACFALSGVHFAFPGLTRSVIAIAGGNASAPTKPRLAASTAAAASLDTLAARARAAVPGAALSQIKLPKRPDEAVDARVKTPFDGHHEGNSHVFLNPVTADIVRIDRFGDLPAGRKAVLLMESLHMARFMAPGWPSVILRLPWVLMGLAPGLLFVTGFLMWWNRVASKRLAAVAPGRLALVPGSAYAQRPAVSGLVLDERRLGDPRPTAGIGRQDIATRNNRLLSDVLARMPGVFLTGPPGSEENLRLRGLDKEYRAHKSMASRSPTAARSASCSSTASPRRPSRASGSSATRRPNTRATASRAASMCRRGPSPTPSASTAVWVPAPTTPWTRR